MLSRKQLAIALLMVCVGQANLCADDAPTGWLSDYAAARKLARELDRPLLLHFYATWCGPCQSMERSVLNTGDVKQSLGRDVIGVKIDSDRHRNLVDRFAVRSLPSDIIIDSEGRILHRSAGFQDKAAYTRMIAGSVKQYEPRVPAAVVSETPDGAPAAEPILGLDGYSPVVLMEERKWLKGKPEFAHTYQGITFHFRTDEELRRFKEDPARFAPKLLGCDPVELWLSDRALRGDTRYGAYFDGKLFLFVSHENRETFKDNPLRYTETRHVLKTSDIVLR